MIPEAKRHTLPRIQEIIADQLSVEQHDVQLETNLVGDLGADSLDQVEIIMAIEDEFDFEIPETVSADLSKSTIAELVKYVDSRLNE